MSRWIAVLITLLVMGYAGLGDAGRGPERSSDGPVRHRATPARARPKPRKPPNIVFILTDDLSMDLLSRMPHVLAMEHAGLTFTNYFVSDSLCCPSRSSILTGNLPHDTGVFKNTGQDGGFHVFHRRGEEAHTFAVALRRRGYATAMMGKYLNGYMGTAAHAMDGLPPRNLPPSYVPPGWSEWDVAGWGYPEFNYTLNQNGRLRRYGGAPADYLTTVIGRLARKFIDRSAGSGRPFFAEIATFAPHGPYVPAPRDAGKFPHALAPRPPSFNVIPSRAPRWLAHHEPLQPSQVADIDRVFRLRVEQVQSIDRMIGQIEAELRARRVARSTYIVFSSDNGLHLGEYRLTPGKLTAFDTDIHVPLVIVGPGVPRGARTAAITENIDLAPTFAALGGASLPSDGHSLLALIHGAAAPRWRNAALIEHHGADLFGGDPDFQTTGAGSPRTYEAMRTRRMLYVEYDDGERELYDLRRDPFELHNLAARIRPARLARLHAALVRMEQCHGDSACWTAMQAR